jgi:tripartite-type tricarboxylate transporter receptor subunit TctC
MRIRNYQDPELIRREGTMIRHSLICCGLTVALTVSGPAWGQDYPNRQITILVGIAAGGITDVTTRQYAAVVSKNIDQKGPCGD